MNIKFNQKIYLFEDMPLGTAFLLPNKPDPELVFLRIADFTNDIGESYNALNLATMEYAFFDEYDNVFPYKATIVLE